MPKRWFRLPTYEPEDYPYEPERPDLLGHEDDVDGKVALREHPDGAPFWVVRVHADEDVLDALADEPKAVDLGDTPTGTLNKMKGRDWPGDEWEDRFRIG